MNTNSELERIIHDWLEDRVVDPPHGSMDEALGKVGSASQQRHRWLAWLLDRGGAATAGRPVRDTDDRGRDQGFRLIFSTAVVAIGVAVIVLIATIGMRLDTTQPIVPAVRGTTHVVSLDGGAFDSIGAAVQAAAEGDTILIGPGVYEEALVIDKDITLRGDVEPPREAVIMVPQDAPDPVLPLAPFDEVADRFSLPERVPVGVQIIDADAMLQDLVVTGEGDGIALLVQGGSPTLERVTLKHAGEPLLPITLAGGLFIEDGSAATVLDSEIWYRVRIGEGSAPTIRGSTFQHPAVVIQDGSMPTFDGNTVSGGCDCAATIVSGGSSATFTGNRFVNTGLHVAGHDGDGTSALVEDNRFSGSGREGVLVTDGATAMLSGNDFYSNQQGLRVAEATAEVRDNQFVGNWNSVLFRDTDSTLAGNTIRGGTIGVSVSDPNSPLIRDNLIENVSMRGLLVARGASPTIEGNTICGSSVNLYLAEGAEPTIGENDICPDLAPAAD